MVKNAFNRFPINFTLRMSVLHLWSDIEVDLYDEERWLVLKFFPVAARIVDSRERERERDSRTAVGG